MKENLTPAQLICIKTIFGKLKVPAADAEIMVAGYSSDGSEHVSDLSKFEAFLLIRHLKSLDPEEAKAEIMRRKIIAMAYERYGLPRNATHEQKKEAIIRLDKEWMMKYSYLKKKLNQYTYNQLPKLVTQYEQVYKSFLKAL